MQKAYQITLNNTKRLFVTAMARNKIITKYAVLSNRRAKISDLLAWLVMPKSVLSAIIKIKPTQNVTVNFIKTKASRFVATKPDKIGLSSAVPKNNEPTTVVKQSIEPKKIRNIIEIG